VWGALSGGARYLLGLVAGDISYVQNGKRKRPVTDGGCRRAQEARRPLGVVDAGWATGYMPRIRAYPDSLDARRDCGQACGLVWPCLDAKPERRHHPPACSKSPTRFRGQAISPSARQVPAGGRLSFPAAQWHHLTIAGWAGSGLRQSRQGIVHLFMTILLVSGPPPQRAALLFSTATTACPRTPNMLGN
jgi:hypothetical protein